MNVREEDETWVGYINSGKEDYNKRIQCLNLERENKESCVSVYLQYTCREENCVCRRGRKKDVRFN